MTMQHTINGRTTDEIFASLERHMNRAEALLDSMFRMSCVALGMPEDITDPVQVDRWFEAHKAERERQNAEVW